jgi:hypothetical protein
MSTAIVVILAVIAGFVVLRAVIEQAVRAGVKKAIADAQLLQNVPSTSDIESVAGNIEVIKRRLYYLRDIYYSVHAIQAYMWKRWDLDSVEFNIEALPHDRLRSLVDQDWPLSDEEEAEKRFLEETVSAQRDYASQDEYDEALWDHDQREESERDTRLAIDEPS